jgi:hypothetical protein
MSIYQELKEAKVEMSSWQSDLYVPINETTTQIVLKYKSTNHITTFRHDKDGELWYEILFAYEPHYPKPN